MMPGEVVAPALEMHDVSCTRADASITLARLTIPARRFTALRGMAGGGKELLLKIAGLLETVDSGELLVDGVPTQSLDEMQRAEMRRRHFGYLFSAPFLLPAFTVIENVVMPMFKVLDSGPSEARKRAEELLLFAGVQRLEQERAGDLSSADQRRVALVRALCTAPSILIVEDLDADLSSDEKWAFTKLLRDACSCWSLTTIVTTSADWVPAGGDVVFEVNEGRVCARAEELPRG